jgi:hypothetical protein
MTMKELQPVNRDRIMRLLRHVPKVCFAALLFFPSVSEAAGDEQTVSRIDFKKLSEWREKSFKGHTSYSLEQNNGITVLRAQATGTASGLYRTVTVNASSKPILTWSWKIQQTVTSENPFLKSGDDFVARLYVIFPGGYFWQTRALVYVWSDKLPVGTVIPNVYTEHAAIIVVESGNRYAETWRHESRNYVEDFRSYFHSAPPDPKAVAIMTDGDNTGSEAIAWYGEIIFSAVQKK